MLEFDLSLQDDQPKRETLPVAVFGIGGAGANVLDTIALENIPGARLVSLNTDIRALQNGMTATKLQLGKALTQGLGAGGDPELGVEAARASEAEIREQIRGAKMVFICAGLGGGTGSGAAPYVAKLAKEEGAFVVCFATLPFSFEGKRRLQQAEESLECLRIYSNALLVFENDRMGELVLPKKGIQEAFHAADRVVSQSIKAITNMVTQPGLIEMGLDDIISALRNEESRCLFGYGIAKGENRAQEALAQALKSPLLDRGELLDKASTVLIHVCGGTDMTLFEVELLMRAVGKHLNEDVQLLFGTGSDSKMGGSLSLTLISSLSAATGKVREVIVPETRMAPAPQPMPTAPPVAHVAVAPAPAPVYTAPTPAPEPAPAPKIEQATVETPAVKAIQTSAHSAVVRVPVPAAKAPAPRQPEPAPAMEVADPEEAAAFFDEEEIIEFSPKRRQQPQAEIQQEEYAEYGDEEDEVPQAQQYQQEEEEPRAREVHLREIAQPTHKTVLPSPRNGAGSQAAAEFDETRPGFASWKREESRRSQLPQEEPIKVPAVSDFVEEEEPPVLPRVTKPAARNPFSLPRAQPAPATTSNVQQNFDESLAAQARGRFEKTEPTLTDDGDNLDIPTYLRRKSR